AQFVLETLRTRGASFARDLAGGEEIDQLAAARLITNDGFITRAHGRWSIVERAAECDVEQEAWLYLRRYGVVFRRLLTRESGASPWRELARVYRRLEARGEIRGGRFVTGVSGEQFALPDAVERLREVRRTPRDGRVVVVCGSDPLNLTGIVTTGERVRATAATRLAYRDGAPVAVMEGDYVRPLGEAPDAV